MPKCEVKRGFLALRDCGAVTSRLCSECGRPACDEHMVASDNGKAWVCVDCQGRHQEPTEDDAAQRPALFRHGYRDHYYRDHGYGPFYAAAYYDTYYDDYDVRAFDRELAEPSAAADDATHDGAPDPMDS